MKPVETGTEGTKTIRDGHNYHPPIFLRHPFRTDYNCGFSSVLSKMATRATGAVWRF